MSLSGHFDTFALFEQFTTLTQLEQQIVFMAANYENDCHYCVPVHNYLMTAYKMPAGVTEILREGQPLATKSCRRCATTRRC